MKKKETKSKITLANIISILGLAAFASFSFLGCYYKNGGELSWSIIIALSFTAFTALLLGFMIKAKGAENRLETWRIIELSTLVIYFIFAIFTSMHGGIMHFFVVCDKKEEIKEYANEDLSKIEKLIADYKDFENEAIAQTYTGLRNATGPHQVCSAKLNKFMNDNGIKHTRVSADSYIIIQKNSLVGNDFKNWYKNEILPRFTKIQNDINAWSTFKIPSRAKEIDEIAGVVQCQLNTRSAESKLPYINYDPGARCYDIGEYQTRTFAIDGEADSLKFKKAIKEANGFSGKAALIIIIIHLLILFNYIVAYRTSTVGISKHGEDDGGIILS